MAGTPIRARRFVRVLNCALALLLVVAVASLCTIAKVNWYLPQSNPGHYLTTATKMRVAHGSVALHTDALQFVRKLVVSLQPELAMFLDDWRETSVLRMLWTAILIHRSPPSESA
jgi:hypothetical protein